MIIDLNIKCKTVKLLQNNIGKNPDNFGYGSEFLYTAPKIQSMK